VFVDEAKILVKAGSGGNGCVAFRREKFCAARRALRAAMAGMAAAFIWKRIRTTIRCCATGTSRVQSGPRATRRRVELHGAFGRRHDFAGFQVGTLVFDGQNGETMADLAVPGQRVLVAQGGRGGPRKSEFCQTVAPGHRREHEDGHAGEGTAFAAGTATACGCWIGGLPECGKVDADFGDIGGANRRLRIIPLLRWSRIWEW